MSLNHQSRIKKIGDALERTHPDIAMFYQTGLTDTDIDNLFELAISIENQ